MTLDPSELIQSIEARLVRAGEHLDTLRRDVEHLPKDDRIHVSVELNDARTEASCYIRTGPPYPWIRWSVVASEFLHCLRTALDHAVFAVASTEANSLTPPEDWRLCFPIGSTKAKWRDVKRCIRTLPEGVREIIDDAQPYHGRSSNLTVLGRIGDVDKHRLPWFLPWAIVGRPRVEFRRPPQGQVLCTKVARGPVFKGPAIVIEFSEPQASEPDIDVEPTFAIFMKQPSGAWGDALDVLGGLREEVESIVERLKPFIGTPSPIPGTKNEGPDDQPT